MSLSGDLKAWNAKVERRRRAIFRGVVDAVFQSITAGSPLTGSPGQPFQSGDLLRSWQDRSEGEHSAAISTKLFYARSIEDGVNLSNGQLINLNSTVGGFHSVALTRAGFQPLLDDVTRKVVEST